MRRSSEEAHDWWIISRAAAAAAAVAVAAAIGRQLSITRIGILRMHANVLAWLCLAHMQS